MLRADLHIHTEYSFDCTMSLKRVISRCLKLGINCVAIADHGTIAGALKLREIAPFPVIVAEEVLTPLGEIMGLFLQEEIPSGLSLEESIGQIKAQEGLVVLPHAFDRFRGIGGRKPEVMEKILPQVDIIEVFNARALPLSKSNSKASFFARNNRLLMSAGSDAHIPLEIGRAYVEMPEFSSIEEFRSSLAKGKIFGHRSPPWVHLFSEWAKIKKRSPKVR